MSDYDALVPPSAPRRPRGRIVAEWRAPWMQDPAHKRRGERAPAGPEFDADIEAYLFFKRTRGSGDRMS